MTIKETKNQIRADYKSKRALMCPKEKTVRDDKIYKTFTESDIYKNAKTLLLYCAAKGEIETKGIMLKALADSKKIALPKCNDDLTMQFLEVTSLDDLENGTYNIDCPKETCKEHIPTQLDLCIVPGLVFDINGYRLGYGKGYYDRFLSEFDGVCAGLVYHDFIVASLPRGKYDCSLDYLVTDKGIRFIKKMSGKY